MNLGQEWWDAYADPAFVDYSGEWGEGFTYGDVGSSDPFAAEYPSVSTPTGVSTPTDWGAIFSGGLEAFKTYTAYDLQKEALEARTGTAPRLTMLAPTAAGGGFDTRKMLLIGGALVLGVGAALMLSRKPRSRKR